MRASGKDKTFSQFVYERRFCTQLENKRPRRAFQFGFLEE
jgi:hypothetical protein